MAVDLDAARAFVRDHARPLDARRLDVVLGDAGAVAAAREALDGYAGADGGYGRGLEPDLRAAEAQPAAAMHAFEALADIGDRGPRGAALCDWLAAITLPDGGLPFALPIADPAGCAPFWACADPSRSSLQITAGVAAEAHRLARHDPAVASHPWPMLATGYCLAAMEAHEGPLPALALMSGLRLLQAIDPPLPRATAQLHRLAAQIPHRGILHVEGGADDEYMRPLDFAPRPDDPARAHIDPAAVEADLARLAGGQEPDGGWRADWISYSQEAAAEWRGYLTVRAVVLLRANGVM